MRTAIGLIATAAVLGACAPSQEELPGEEADEVAYRLEVKPGDPVALGDVSVIAPNPGIGVFAEVFYESGETETLHLLTDARSAVYLVPESLEDVETDADGDEPTVVGEAAGEATASGSPGPCSDRGRNPLPYKVKGNLDWRFNAASTPSANNVDKVESAMRRAANNITRSDNSCGLADLVSVTNTYKGRTSAGTQINADATCKATGNGINTVGFGDLPKGVLGLACVYYDGEGHVVEADIRLNKVDHSFYAVKHSSCTSKYSIEAVMTHEFGHVFGLGHTGEAAHGNQTMSPKINGPCQNSESTLGRGDVIGLRGKY